MGAQCSASKRRRHELDKLIIPYLCCYELKRNRPSAEPLSEGAWELPSQPRA